MKTKIRKKILKDFTFETTISRSYTNENGEMFLEGIASSNQVDLLNTKFNAECQEGFVQDCLEDTIIIELAHNELSTARFAGYVGKVIDAKIVENDMLEKVEFIVTIKLDPDHPFCDFIYKACNGEESEFPKPKIALSIHGKPEKVHYELIDGRKIKVFDRVRLTHIAITDRPANTDATLEAISRSFIGEEMQIIKASDILNMIDSQITDMVNGIAAIKTADLKTEDLFYLIREFIEKYSDRLKWSTFGDFQDDLCEMLTENEIESRAFVEKLEENVSRSVEAPSKNILLDILENKLIEIKEASNGRQSESGEITITTNDKGADTNTDSDTKQRCSENQQDQSNNSTNQHIVMENVEKVTEIVAETPVAEQVAEVIAPVAAEVEQKEDFETISRSLFSDMAKQLKDQFSEVFSAFSDKIESLTKEINIMKEQPASMPIAETISRSLPTKTLKKASEMTDEERANTLFSFFNNK